MALFAHFMEQLAQGGNERKIFAPEALELLATSEWPGNVRQLSNVVRQTCALAANDAESHTEVRHLRPWVRIFSC